MQSADVQHGCVHTDCPAFGPSSVAVAQMPVVHCSPLVHPVVPASCDAGTTHCPVAVSQTLPAAQLVEVHVCDGGTHCFVADTHTLPAAYCGG